MKLHVRGIWSEQVGEKLFLLPLSLLLVVPSHSYVPQSLRPCQSMQLFSSPSPSPSLPYAGASKLVYILYLAAKLKGNMNVLSNNYLMILN